MRTGPSAAVIICTYTLDRWDDLVRAVESAAGQAPPPDELVIVSDHDEELYRRASERWPAARVLRNSGRRGLSGARNTGVGAARSDVVAFLDDDAAAEPGWLAALVAPFADPRVFGTGGWAEPAWEAGRPAWFPRELDWVVGCSYLGLPETEAPIRNPLGCNMAFRRSAVVAAGGFRSELGRLGQLPLGGEETELSLRIAGLHPDGVVLHVPAARVRHRVPAWRGTWSYVAARCYQEGRSKAVISAVTRRGSLGTERRYATRTLPAGVLRGIGQAIRGDLAGARRAAAIVAGLAITTAGYLAGRTGLDRVRPAGEATPVTHREGA